MGFKLITNTDSLGIKIKEGCIINEYFNETLED